MKTLDSKTETVSDNELIAQFMGFKKTGKHFVMDGEKVEQYQHPSYGRCYPHEWDAFARSWSWLMPVVEKIDKIHSKHFYYDPLEMAKGIFPKDDNYMNVITLPVATPISQVYKTIVEFIKWYNNDSTISR